MINLGDKIKELRVKQGMTQKELANGICTQASVSNLENNTSVPSLVILLAIGERLNIEFSELTEYALEQASPSVAVFKRVQNLRSQFKLQEAHDYIKNELNLELLKTSHEKKQYYYYLGITSLLGYDKISDAIYNFNLGLSVEVDPHLEFLDVLITNGIGLAYYMDSENEKALTYFEKSLNELDEFTKGPISLVDSIELTKLYYTSAKFYSKIEEYEKAINLCVLGIKIQKFHNISYDLDRLYYEKAFNLVKLGKLKEAQESYGLAAALAKMDQKELVLETIRDDMKQFNLGVCPY